MSKGKDTALVPVSDYAIAQYDPRDLAATLAMNVGSATLSALDLERIKVPSGGSLAWTIETLDGEETVRSLVGVVVGARDARAYWSRPMGEGGCSGPPDCRSDDGVIGFGSPGGSCATCPLARFGSDRHQRGQACKAMRLLFVVQPESALPKVLVVPPSSLKTVRKYGLRLASRGARLGSVVTAFDLERTQNPDGIAYARIVPRVVARLEPADAERMARVGDALAGLFSAVEVTAEDVTEDARAHHARDDEVPF
jgi:hypothetical protein